MKGGTTYRYTYDHTGARTAYFDGTATTTYANRFYDSEGQHQDQAPLRRE